MRVGLSLLTLVPGISGGSETYARELARRSRASARTSISRSCRRSRPTPAAGSRRSWPTSTRARRSTAGAPSGDGRGDAPARPLRSLLARRRRRPLPADRPGAAAGRAARASPCSTSSTSTCPSCSRAASGCSGSSPTTAPRAGATEVIVISEFVRERVVERLGLDPEHVHAVWLGVDHDALHARRRTSRASRCCSTPRGPGRTRTTRACSRRSRWSAATDRSSASCSPASATTLAALPEGVEARGVSGAELIELYRRAACLVFPSLYEGFGLPPVEAMACGCPVAASAAARCPRCAATRPSSSTRSTPRRSRQGSTRRSNAPQS